MTQGKILLITEAERIGNEIIGQAKKDEHGIYWETLAADGQRNYRYDISPNLYNGCGGIALFLMELFKHTKKVIYRDACISAGERLRAISAFSDDSSNSFYTGRMGTVYLFIYLYKQTGDQAWLDSAIELTKKVELPSGQQVVIDDLINGSSGSLLVMLHLYTLVKETWLEEKILSFAEFLIRRAHVSSPGALYWDRSYQQITGLCGFSHGAAGVAFVFIQLGKIFRNPAYFEIARMAFNHEQKHFSRKYNNWLDLRKGFYNDAEYQVALKAYESADPDFFTNGSDMNAWCHGAAGIGFSRMAALEQIKEPVYGRELKAALQKTWSTDGPEGRAPVSFTLCHAAAGNADLFIEEGLRTGDDRYQEALFTIAEKAVRTFQELGFYTTGYGTGSDYPDISLFMGSAGTGYFLLRVLDPKLTPSILNPVVTGSGKKNTFHTRARITELILEKHFAASLRYLSDTDRRTRQHLLEGLQTKGLQTSYLTAIREKLQVKTDPGLKDLIRVEKRILKLDLSPVSAAYYHVRALSISARIEQLRANLERSSWILSDEFDILSSRHYGKYLHPEAASPYVLMRVSPDGVTKELLSEFSFLVLKAFSKRSSYKDALRHVIGKFGELSTEEQQQISQAFRAQVENAVTGHVLIPAD